MSGGIVYTPPDVSALAAAILSNAPPSSEAVAGTAGSMAAASRGDHAHQRLTSTQPTLLLDAAGKRTVLYSRVFDREPGVFPVPKTPAAGAAMPSLSYEHVTAVANGVTSWVGCIITGMQPGVAVTVLGLSVLSASVPAANAGFNVTAIATSQPA